MKFNPVNAHTWFLRLAVVVGCVFWIVSGALAEDADSQQGADRKFESLTIGDQTFHDVQVVRQTPSDIMFRHAGGITGFKVQYLDKPTLRRLGYEIAPSAPTPVSAASERLETLPDLVPPGNVRWGLLMLSLGLCALICGTFVYTGYVFRLICLKSGTAPGFAIWLPFFQAFPLLRAARMSWAWMVAVTSLSVLIAYAAFRAPQHTMVLFGILLAAIIGLSLVWSVRICHACGKSSLFAVLLLLPGLNYLALVHLAGSK